MVAGVPQLAALRSVVRPHSPLATHLHRHLTEPQPQLPTTNGHKAFHTELPPALQWLTSVLSERSAWRVPLCKGDNLYRASFSTQYQYISLRLYSLEKSPMVLPVRCHLPQRLRWWPVIPKLLLNS